MSGQSQPSGNKRFILIIFERIYCPGYQEYLKNAVVLPEQGRFAIISI